MTEETISTIKNHGKWFLKVTQVYFLAVALGWAAFPLILALLARYMTIDMPMAVFSVFVTIVFAVMLLTTGDEIGLQDRKPYKWAKYKGKGFVIGAAVGIAVFLLELLVIAIANSVFRVSHPQFAISGINNYLRMVLYSPFFWFFELLTKGSDVVPRVTVLTSLIVIPFVSGFTGIGYMMGLNGIDIDLKRRRKKDGN